MFTLKRQLVLLAVVAAVVAALLLSPMAWPFDLAVIAVILLTVGGYAHALRRTRDKRQVDPRRPIIKPTHQWISDAAFDRLRFALLSSVNREKGQDNEVLLVTRLHWSYLFVAAGPAAALVLGLAVYMIIEGMPAVLIAVALTFGALATWIGVIEWLYRYLMITDTSLIIMRVPPVWLPLMEAPVDRLALSSIRLVRNDDSVVGNLLGFGTVEVDTPLQKDERFNRMAWLPRHEDIVALLQTAIHRS